ALDKVYTFYTCDSMKKVAEAINENFIPTDIYLLPRNREREESRQFFKKELINFKNSLENLTGKKITEDDLREQIVLYNKNRALLKKISDLRKRNNPPLTGQDFLELTKAAYYLPPEEQLQIFTNLYEELSAVPDKGVRPIRIMMTGGIVGDGDRRLLEIVENEIGARIVVEDHCSGLSPFYYQISENQDPYLALADGYLNQAPCARMSPLEDRIDFSGKLAKEYDVDAVLFTYLKFCPCYGITKNSFLRYFQSLGLPVLELPIDYSRGDEGQIKTRVEAFIEVLSEKGSA
ncbi:MAG: 2-hydroxyacyl-CoA dehydratase, partial [Candidatus Methanofastidiosa archaeon]|nr:2-hydroxyacyl-CoA dehydratase [Candidatus Methanofastidiosa archaeon]